MIFTYDQWLEYTQKVHSEIHTQKKMKQFPFQKEKILFCLMANCQDFFEQVKEDEKKVSSGKNQIKNHEECVNLKIIK